MQEVQAAGSILTAFAGLAALVAAAGWYKSAQSLGLYRADPSAARRGMAIEWAERTAYVTAGALLLAVLATLFR